MIVFYKYPKNASFLTTALKIFLCTFEPGKIYFFTKIVSSTFTGVRIFGTSEQNCINRKLKALAYPQSENFNRNPWKTFLMHL